MSEFFSSSRFSAKYGTPTITTLLYIQTNKLNENEIFFREKEIVFVSEIRKTKFYIFLYFFLNDTKLCNISIFFHG